VAADATALLRSARRALDGELGLPPSQVTRSAALFIRTALESIVEEHLTRANLYCERAGMRVKLICLQVQLGEPAGSSAAWAWAALSGACHHHAYELSPTQSEIEHLLNTISALR
jgi:hypothetical protein